MVFFLPDSFAGAAARRGVRGVNSALGSGGSGGGGGASFDFTFKDVKFYPGPFDTMINAPSGMVGRYLSAHGHRMVIAAKRQAGKDTMELVRSIYMIHNRAPRGQQLRIGSNAKHALIHHQGTRPHIITPNKATHLRFHSGGRLIVTRLVRHPGTKPNRYLSDQLTLIKV